ncbi:hypothetical protein FA13DRAFT_1604941, partial [Coprinellus micaceus]
GTGTPAEAHPSSIRREGKNHVSSRVGIPRESDEAKEWQSYKGKLQEAFTPMFAWIEKTLRTLLPDTFTVLEQSVDILPLGDSVLAHPFTGFVLNFNVSTVIHRDYQDKEICMVFQISDCEGGELCLVEPGLVFRLRNGDGVIFRSHQISHFNNHFIGRRMSLVFHTDKAMDGWVDDYNDW